MRIRIRQALHCSVLAVACLFAATSGPAHGAHPSLTEDTGTQGEGHVELELGASTSRPPDGRVTGFEPQLSIGVTEQLDAIVRPTFLWISSADDRSRGIAATTTDVKWRFLELDGLNIGLRAGVDWPTGSDRLGGTHTAMHGLLMMTRSIGEGSVSLNVGVDRRGRVEGERRHVMQLAAGVVFPVAPAVTLVADLGVQSNPEGGRSTAPAVASVGFIARVSPRLDVDVGYRRAFNEAARPNVLLAGATLRW